MLLQIPLHLQWDEASEEGRQTEVICHDSYSSSLRYGIFNVTQELNFHKKFHLLQIFEAPFFKAAYSIVGTKEMP